MKNDSIAIVLRRARAETGKKQYEVAKALGISSNFLSLLENGRREPSVAVLRKAAKYYGMRLEVGFGEY